MEKHWQDKEKQHLKQCLIRFSKSVCAVESILENKKRRYRPVIEYSSDSILKARTAIGNAHDSVSFWIFL